MTVTRLEPWSRQRCKVFLEEDFAFALYRGEIRRFRLEEGGELTEEVHREILDMLSARAREKSLYYLQARPRTESEVRKKLREGLYPEACIDKTIIFLKEYRFLDDDAYVRDYIGLHRDHRSTAEMERFLLRRGIGIGRIREIMDEMAVKDSGELIRYYIKKRGVDPSRGDEKERRRMLAFLLRRGFRFDEIRQAAPGLMRGGPDLNEFTE